MCVIILDAGRVKLAGDRSMDGATWRSPLRTASDPWGGIIASSADAT